jgi:hypothetical protein
MLLHASQFNFGIIQRASQVFFMTYARPRLASAPWNPRLTA